MSGAHHGAPIISDAKKQSKRRKQGDTATAVMKKVCAPLAHPPSTVTGVPERRDGSEEERALCDRVKKACQLLAAVEVTLRRVAVGDNEIRQPDFRKLVQTKRNLFFGLKELKTEVIAMQARCKGAALAECANYLDFALSVTSTVPSASDLEDDQLRRIFTEVLRTSGNCPSAMLTLSRVCKRWKRLVRSSDVWSALHLNKLSNVAADQELLKLIGTDHAFAKLSSVSLNSCQQLTERSVLPLLRCCGPHLTSLDLTGCWLLKKVTLEELVASCPNVRMLNMTKCSGIQLEDVLDVLQGTKLAGNLRALGIAYMGGVCHRVSRANFLKVGATATRAPTTRHALPLSLSFPLPPSPSLSLPLLPLSPPFPPLFLSSSLSLPFVGPLMGNPPHPHPHPPLALSADPCSAMLSVSCVCACGGGLVFGFGVVLDCGQGGGLPLRASTHCGGAHGGVLPDDSEPAWRPAHAHGPEHVPGALLRPRQRR